MVFQSNRENFCSNRFIMFRQIVAEALTLYLVAILSAWASLGIDAFVLIEKQQFIVQHLDWNIDGYNDWINDIGYLRAQNDHLKTLITMNTSIDYISADSRSKCNVKVSRHRLLQYSQYIHSNFTNFCPYRFTMFQRIPIQNFMLYLVVILSAWASLGIGTILLFESNSHTTISINS